MSEFRRVFWFCEHLWDDACWILLLYEVVWSTAGGVGLMCGVVGGGLLSGCCGT